MPTKLYLSSTQAAETTPSYDSVWSGGTASADRKAMSTTKDGSAITSKAVTGDTVLHRQYISSPISASVAFTTSVTYRLQIRALSNSGGTVTAAVIKVLTSAGALRGTITSGDTSDAVSSSTLTNDKVSGSCEGAFTAQIGDRIVMDIGHVGSATNTYSYGSSSATDLGNNETDTAANNPYLELSNTITFSGGAAPTTSNKLMLLGVG